MIEAGDVVTVYFLGAAESKRRPAIVVSKAYNDQNYDVVLALITSNLKLASTDFDYHLQDWREAGLKGPSAVRVFIGMSELRDVRKIGRLSDADWQEVQARLKLALEI